MGWRCRMRGFMQQGVAAPLAFCLIAASETTPDNHKGIAAVTPLLGSTESGCATLWLEPVETSAPADFALYERRLTLVRLTDAKEICRHVGSFIDSCNYFQFSLGRVCIFVSLTIRLWLRSVLFFFVEIPFTPFVAGHILFLFLKPYLTRPLAVVGTEKSIIDRIQARKEGEIQI
ncbi:hypothetical protein GGR57DRAFT_195593 [Xylariaceae sp. FL1272]|nr:hypothetical protein GGR57DRAFT_195593 [Xylariaceae sp. FL1272]